MEGAAIVATLMKELANPTVLYINYYVRCKRHVNGFQNKVQNLLRLENEVKMKVNLARDNGDVILQVVQHWLEQVVEVQGEVVHQATSMNSSFEGWCYACHHLGKELEKKLDGLLAQGNIFSSVSNPAPVPPRVAEHFDAFASREATKKKVIEALKDINTKLVGVYGMGGVGKTIFIKEIREQVEETKLFDKVVYVTVSQNLDLRGIQTQIAESLNIKIEEQSIPARAAKLSAKLKQEKSILLMLDDLWKRLELNDVGIILSDVGENICKVLITSRKLDVCDSMNTTENIKVNVLSKNDSLELFRQEVGDIDFNSQHVTLEEVVNECDGLPLAIVTLARTLRNKDKGFWTAVIQQLRKSMYEGMDPVNSSIRVSYDFLKSSKTKLCFLLCALFPEDHKLTMDTLVGYAMGEGLLGEVETLSEARGNLHIMVDTLVSSGLLLKGDDEGYVIMHDIVRDAAISIARENESESIMNAGLGLQKWPKLKEAGKCLRLSLMSNDICEVPVDIPECSQLVTLSLASNRSLVDIPDGFFEGMKRLATLDLSDTHILYLPQSLSSLNNCLRSLYLDGCWSLAYILPIGNLKTLEILSCKKAGISQLLPEEISGLTNLKMLDLSHTGILDYILPNVISSLSSLEELYMHDSFSGWKIEGTEQMTPTASLAEVASLTNLTSLHLDIVYTKCLSTDIGSCHHWETLENFEIRILESKRLHMDVSKSKKYVFLETNSDSFPVAAWVNVLMKTTYDLHLEWCFGLKNVLQLNPKGRFYNLKTLQLENCPEMEYVVNVEEPETIFPQLETLNLLKMKILKAIWNGPLVERSFEKLKVLEITWCPELVNVLPSLLWTRLQNLQEIEIMNCHKLEKVFESDGFEDGHASILKLRSMKLYKLNSLTSIWKGAVPLIRLENLKILNVYKCPNLRSRHLFPSVAFTQRFQQLEELEVSSCHQFTKLIAEEAEGMEIKSCPINFIALPPQPPIFSNLKKLNIKKCNGLKCIFPIQILQSLLQLEELEVFNCFDMEELFEFEVCQEEEDGSMTIRLPHLRILKLKSLARLSSFFCHQRKLHHVLLDCPSLEELEISECPNLKRLPFGPQSIPKLEKFLIKTELFETLEWDDLSVKSQLQQFLSKDLVCALTF
ncbi:hypothetical protein GIB67_013101 [Kingdonia uniflora]|uniref:AAA+ ATPase domain-containing protein n=1 Tax=Kingdonia uniflora TaxID=39325 RepID=A0A7J7NNF3_9MAGN|nr:hypothetical protein GIB67_013101 [Kingdonia uniflora]